MVQRTHSTVRNVSFHCDQTPTSITPWSQGLRRQIVSLRLGGGGIVTRYRRER